MSDVSVSAAICLQCSFHASYACFLSVAVIADFFLVAALGDRLAKLSSVIEKLDKKANVVDAIEVFMAFSKWLQFRAQGDPNITPELLRTFNYYQDLFISDKMNNGFSCTL